MLYTKSVFVFLFIYSYIEINAVPPEACFANFRWDDCGGAPKRVLYYWKPGSRCEVGTWRGCLPNPNMFHDEYDCVRTCIFSARALPEDYHKVTETDEPTENVTDTTEATNVTEKTANDNTTTIESITNATVTDVGNATDVIETTETSTHGTEATVPESKATGDDTTPGGDTATVTEASDSPAK